MTFNHAIRLAKDTGDQEAHCLSMEGLAAVYFRMGDYDKSIPAYKEAMALLPANNKNNEEYTIHSERIVSKLSDAIQFQLESQQGKLYENQSSPKVTHSRKISNSKRFFQDKQHSLIAKGLEANSSSDGNEEQMSECEESFGKHQPGDGLNFSMKSTMNKYEQPIGDAEVPRATKELYLAQICQDKNSKRNEDLPQEKKKESSKMCVVM